jgi:hypothetical protein
MFLVFVEVSIMVTGELGKTLPVDWVGGLATVLPALNGTFAHVESTGEGWLGEAQVLAELAYRPAHVIRHSSPTAGPGCACLPI